MVVTRNMTNCKSVIMNFIIGVYFPVTNCKIVRSYFRVTNSEIVWVIEHKRDIVPAVFILGRQKYDRSEEIVLNYTVM